MNNNYDVMECPDVQRIGRVEWLWNAERDAPEIREQEKREQEEGLKKKTGTDVRK